MSTTANLVLTLIEQSQSQKEVTANAAITALDAALAGALSVAVTTADVTLTTTQAQNAIYQVTGTLTGNRSLIIPAAAGSKLLLVYNNTAGAFSLTVKKATGTGVTVQQGKRAILYYDGTNVVDVIASAATSTSYTTTVQTITYSATPAIDWSLGSTARITLTGNATFSFSGAVDGQTVVLEVIQDATGSRLATWPGSVAFGTDVTAATLTTTASKRDFVAFKYNATEAKYYCLSIVKGY
jgi:hypothetical protein